MEGVKSQWGSINNIKKQWTNKIIKTNKTVNEGKQKHSMYQTYMHMLQKSYHREVCILSIYLNVWGCELLLSIIYLVIQDQMRSIVKFTCVNLSKNIIWVKKSLQNKLSKYSHREHSTSAFNKEWQFKSSVCWISN